MKRYRVFIGVLIAVPGACMRTAAVRERPADYLAANSPPTATLTMAQGSPVVVTLPRVVSDTIFGWSKGKEVSIPVQEVKEVKVRRVAVVQNAIMGGIVLGAGAALLIAKAGKATPSDTGDPCAMRVAEC